MDNKPVQTQTQSGGRPHEIIKGLTSIIMSVYIRDYSILHYTGHAIGAVREHTNPEITPYELVIVDDGSSIVLPPKQYHCDKFIKNEEN